MRLTAPTKPLHIPHCLIIWLRRLALTSILLFVLAIAAVAGVRVYSALSASGDIYTLDAVPARPVAIIFGAAVYDNGNLSAMLEDRVKTGADLYKAGKVNALLMTGDNHIDTYNEPKAMRDYAVRLGVPYDAIALDYAGFRTYDSCYRAHDIFRVDKAILITQAFHLDRALLACNQLGLESVGVAADAERAEGYSQDQLFSSTVREIPSTVLVVIDLLRGKKPVYLGDPVPISTQLRPLTTGYIPG